MHLLAAAILAMTVVSSGLPSRGTDGCLAYSRADGLASDTVLDICEDGDGVLWFATEGGLSRFDGSSFHTYLSGESVTALCEDADGNLWVGTDRGLNSMNRESGSFSLFGMRRGSSGIKAVHGSQTGEIWAYTSDGVVCRITPDRGGREQVPAPEEEVPYSVGFADFKGAYLEGDYRYCHIFEDIEGNIWIGGRATSVAMLPGGDLSAIRYPVRAPVCERLEGSALAP